jgi:two-component system, OmpR family, phosphate regulon sensor histidine kinase PhoR
MEKKPKTLIPFYILVAYISLQFIWWTYLLSSLSSELTTQKESLLRYKYPDEASYQIAMSELNNKQHRRIIMIGTEGSVFLALLIFGIYRVKRSFEKENQMIQQQKNFMLSVTHELKTPLAAIKLNLQTLLMRQLEKSQQRNILEGSVQDADRLNQMIENVLVASRMESAGVEFFPERVDLSSFVQVFAEKSLQKERLVLQIENGVWIDADKQIALPSLLTNLVENALKYSKEAVKIIVGKEEGVPFMSVMDNGLGISEGEKGKIFQKFYRVGSEETRSAKGTGLGLFIVKYIVDKCNWRIKVEQNLPEGSIFKVYFK